MNYLLLIDHYYPNPLTNGFCIEKIADELSKNNKICVLCYKGIHEKKYYVKKNIKIYKIKPRIFFQLKEFGEERKNTLLGKILLKIAFVIQKIKRVIFIFWSPLTSPLYILKLYFKAKKICKSNDIDVVISTYKPLETIIVGALLKKHNIVKYNISYILDTFTDLRIHKNKLDIFYANIGWRWEKRIYNNSDMVINMRCYEGSYKNERYKKYKNKIFFSDIPYIVNENNNIDVNSYKNEIPKFLYAGTLEKKIRNPENTCKIISECFKDKEYEFNFYCRGDSDDIINKYSKITNYKIVNKGFVSKDILNKALNESIIVTIGNKNSKMISSKIFEFISKNKKIIHFYSDENDSGIPYLKKYPNCLLIDERNSLSDNIKKINNFVDLEIINVKFEELKKIYEENTPEYTVNLIENYMAKENNKKER